MDSKLETAVAAYLDNLNAEISGLPLPKQQEVRAEVLQHLEALAEADVLLGGTSTEAMKVAMRQFGNPRQIGRQLAREWRLREWKRRSVILLKTLVEPVGFVGMAALGTIVLAVISLLTDGPAYDYARWLQVTYCLIVLEAVIKVAHAAYAITGAGNPTAVNGLTPSSVAVWTRERVPLNGATFLCRLQSPHLPDSYLVVAALGAMLLAIVSWASGWSDDITFWMYCASLITCLYLSVAWLLDRPGEFAARQRAKLASLKKFVLSVAGTSGTAIRTKATRRYGGLQLAASPALALPYGALPDRRSVPLNTACFLFPPLGMVIWLALDYRFPRKARSAGRSAVRGAVVALICFALFDIWLSVHTAILAIDNAHLQPINPHHAFHGLRRRTR